MRKRSRRNRSRGGVNKSNFLARNYKKIILWGAAAVGFVGIVAALFGTAIISASSECQKQGYKGSAFFSTTECEADAAYAYDHITIVIGNTANSPMPEYTDEIQKYIKNSTLGGFDIDIISATPSTPRLLRDKVDPLEDSNDYEISQYLERAKSTTDNLSKKIVQSIQTAPTEDHVAYLDAIMKAGHTVANKSEAGEKALVIVIGSGLSDSGILNFAKNDLLSQAPDRIANDVEEFVQEDWLKGVKVFWSGIGATTLPQHKLSSTEITNLKDIYSETLQKTGVKEKDIDLDKDAVDDSRIMQTDHIVDAVNVSQAEINYSLVFDERTSLSFLGDSAEFRDGIDSARASISDAVKLAKDNTAATITIEGYLARSFCGAEPDYALTSARANAVKELFISEGIAPERITAIGKGFGEYDECAAASEPEMEEIRKQNRITKIQIKEN